jgi:hypothetical protein
MKWRTARCADPLGEVVHFGGAPPPVDHGQLLHRLARGGGGGLGLGVLAGGALGVLRVEPLALAAPVGGAGGLGGGGGAEAAVGAPRRGRRRRLFPAGSVRVRAAHRRRQRVAGGGCGGVRRSAPRHQNLVAPADARPDRAQHRWRRRRAGLVVRPPLPEAGRLLLPGARHVRRRLGRRHQIAGRRLRHRPAVFRWRNDDAFPARRLASLDGRFAEEVREDVLVERVGESERQPQARLVFRRRGGSKNRSARRGLLRPRRQLPVGLALHDDMAVAPEQLNEVVVFAGARKSRIECPSLSLSLTTEMSSYYLSLAHSENERNCSVLTRVA